MNAKENDKLRKAIPIISKPNIFVVTRGIANLPAEEQAQIIQKVKDFNNFNEENNPYGEHDFGSFMHNDRKIFWKIDDYAGSEGFNLVLTVMFADEY